MSDPIYSSKLRSVRVRGNFFVVRYKINLNCKKKNKIFAFSKCMQWRQGMDPNFNVGTFPIACGRSVPKVPRTPCVLVSCYKFISRLFLLKIHGLPAWKASTGKLKLGTGHVVPAFSSKSVCLPRIMTNGEVFWAHICILNNLEYRLFKSPTLLLVILAIVSNDLLERVW